jgi:hypothetical protein
MRIGLLVGQQVVCWVPDRGIRARKTEPAALLPLTGDVGSASADYLLTAWLAQTPRRTK